MGNWFEQIKDRDRELFLLENGIISIDLPERPGINLHEDMHGSHLRKLQHQKFKLAYYESRFYKRAFRKWLEPLDRTLPIMDIGAGDGRFVELLLEMGFEKIIATDICMENLLSTASFLKETNSEDKVQLIKCDVLDTPVKPKTINAILAIGVLYYLNEDYEKGKEYIVSFLNKDGILIESEPDLEGQALKAMLFDELDIFVNIVESHKFAEVYGEQSYKLRLFDLEEIKQTFTDLNMDIIDWHGLSLFPLLMVIAKVKGLIKSEDMERLEADLDKTLDYFD